MQQDNSVTVLLFSSEPSSGIKTQYPGALFGYKFCPFSFIFFLFASILCFFLFPVCECILLDHTTYKQAEGLASIPTEQQRPKGKTQPQTRSLPPHHSLRNLRRKPSCSIRISSSLCASVPKYLNGRHVEDHLSSKLSALETMSQRQQNNNTRLEPAAISAAQAQHREQSRIFRTSS